MSQGSVLGPILSSWYTDEKPEHEHNNLTILFDDYVTQIITTGKARKTGLCNRTSNIQKENP